MNSEYLCDDNIQKFKDLLTGSIDAINVFAWWRRQWILLLIYSIGNVKAMIKQLFWSSETMEHNTRIKG